MAVCLHYVGGVYSDWRLDGSIMFAGLSFGFEQSARFFILQKKTIINEMKTVDKQWTPIKCIWYYYLLI